MTQQPERILIVDDDVEFSQLLKDYLIHQGYHVDVAHDGQTMTTFLEQHSIDLLLLDIMLPGEDGLSIAKRLRSEQILFPIIMLSALGDEVDRVVGLEIGADDYLTKPVSLRETLARIRAILRRNALAAPVTESTPAPVKQSLTNSQHLHQFGPFVLNTQSYSLSKDDIKIPLTSAEFNLLMIFVTHPNQVLSRDRLMNLIKGYDHNPFDRSIDVRVRRLRTKIESDPAEPAYIRTIRGEGYLFCPRGEEIT